MFKLQLKNSFLPFFFLVTYITLFCWLGKYTFPAADDFSNINNLLANGFWVSQRQIYLTWSGRLTSTFIMYASYFLGVENIYPFLALFTSLLNLMVIFFLLCAILKNELKWDLLSLSLLFQVVWLASIPALNEIFYWLNGSFYTWTASLSVLCVAMSVTVLRKQRRGVFVISLLGLIFANGMMVETTTMMQVVVTFCFTLYFLWREQHHATHYMIFILGMTLCALLVTLTAPGNLGRMSAGSQMPVSARFFQTLGVASVFGGITTLKFFTKPIVYLVILYMPVITARIEPLDKNIATRLKVWHVFALIMFIACFQQAIAGWATSAGLPARAEGLAIWIMGAAWLFLWSFGYRNEKMFEKIRSLRVYSWRGVLLMSCLLLNGNFISLLQDLRVAPLYAAEQKNREASILRQKNEGKIDIVVPALTVKPRLLFFSDIRPSPSDWKNQSYAQYWGVRSISALPAPLLNDERARRDFLEGKLEGMEALANAGDPEVQFMLGEIYDTTFAPSKEVLKDNETAAKWYRMAAEQGYAPAQRRLTRFYARGMGVPKNYFYAVAWLLRSQF
jgi:hypothetical protein